MNYYHIKNQSRGLDGWGDGAFGASRGSRIHKGRDYKFNVGEVVRSPVDGTILRIGQPYSGESEYRLIELINKGRTMIWRFFYVAPTVKVADFVKAEQEIGKAQSIQEKYNDTMINHVHVECIVDPAWVDKQFEGAL